MRLDIQGRRTGLTALTFAALLTTAGFAQAAAPCGGVQLEDGKVQTKQPLPAKAPLLGNDLNCATAVAAALKARPRLRSVTVAARVPSDRRGDGAKIAAEWAKVIAASGVPQARISTIVPTGPAGSTPTVEIAYREPQPRPVALIQAMTGAVVAGADPKALENTSKGSKLTQGDHVQTAAGAVARLALADGSFVALLPNTLIKLGRVELTRDLKRAVRIDLIKGKVEAIAEPRGKGSSFDVVTRTAVAGVRGTRFRVGVGGGGKAEATAVETVTGAVELSGTSGSKEKVMVVAGTASKVDEKGVPSKPRKLLPATSVEGPLFGAIRRDAVLRWKAVDGAKGYQVEFGGDGEIATGRVAFDISKNELAIPATLAGGHWFWRVAPVDADGFVGMPSKTFSFVLPGKD
ncbi:MAG: FecR domain-containing protein [Deltaproteobacteria bacterium]|nr:FecR domain-containing protein [Deltaproteobacteria bacterium]